ncbi:MAG TPA: hypothetical protein VK171_04590, partial [Fimbriimonas sp.]|nr:hypothetical protein [Fimbriimonas sp.]
LAVCASAMIGAVAMAQDSTDNLSFRIGFDYPTKAATKAAAKDMVGFGFQKVIKVLDDAERYTTSFDVSVDVYSRGNYRHIPILANYVGTSKNGGTFWSAGAGLGFVKRPAGCGTESIGRIAYQVSVGMNFGKAEKAAFVEVKYWGSEATELNALGVYLGFRF